MKRTGAWLAVYALEQIGARLTFGIPGVHTTELYDELNNSNRITQVLVTHECGERDRRSLSRRRADAGDLGRSAHRHRAPLSIASDGHPQVHGRVDQGD